MSRPTSAVPTRTPLCRQVFIDIGAGEGSALLQQAARPFDHINISFYAFEPDPALFAHLQQLVSSGALPEDTVLHHAAAWTHDGQVGAICVKCSISCSRQEVCLLVACWLESMMLCRCDCLLQAVLYLGRHSGSINGASPHSMLAADARATSLLSWLWSRLWSLTSRSSFGAAAETGSLIDDPLDPAPEQMIVHSTDFSTWLLRNVQPQDNVIVHLDAAGAENTLLRRMILDNSISLVDELHVRWHDGPAGLHIGLASAYDELLHHLNLRVESL